MKLLFNKKTAIIIFVLFVAIIYFFDKGLSVGLFLLGVLSLGTLLILKKLGFKDKRIYLLFFIALAIHLGVTLFMHYANFQPFGGGQGDYITYNNQAQQIATRIHSGNFSTSGLGIGHLYPVIIGYIYALTLPSEIIGLIINVWLAVLSVLLVYLIVLELGASEKNAFVVGLIAAIYPSYVFISGLLLKDVFEVCFVMFGLLFTFKIIKKFSWWLFLLLYLSLSGATHFRFYIGYALIMAFILSWFLFSKIVISKRIVYGVIFVIFLGFIPLFSAGQGYYGFNSFKMYINFKMVNFYRNVAYVATPNPTSEKTVTLTAPSTSVSAVGNEVTPKSLVINKPSVSSESVQEQNIGMGSSFSGGGGILGYVKSFFYVLFGPFPWQVKNIRQAFALLETFPWYFLLIFIGSAIIDSIKKKDFKFVVLLIFIIMGMGVIAIFETNFGIIVRIRIPIFMALLCIASLSQFGTKYLNKINV